MSTGFVLNIPDTMLEKLKETDKHISSLATKSKNTEAQVISAFRHMADNGVGYFLQQMRKANELIDKVGTKGKNMNVGAGMFADIAVQAKNAIDEVNRVVTAISKVKRASGDTGMAKNPFAGMSESLKQWNNLQSQIDATDAKIKKLTSTTMDYERQMQRVRSGQTTPMNVSYNEYAYTKERIAALQEEKRVLREKQEEITRQNNALSEQVRIQESLKHFVANQDSLPNRRSRDDYENLRRQLAEEEKASEKAEQKRVKDVEKAEKEAAKIREAERKKREKEEKATADRIAAYDSKARRERYKAYTTTYEGAMRTSDRAKTLLQEQQAIKNLEAARAKLNKTDSDYANKLRNLNQRILEHKNNIDKATAGSKNLQTQHRSLMDISGQLARKLALVFSVSQITGYVKKLIEVRGEFELQQRSLQAILQNKDEANKIWQQTVDLAVRSPFRVKELVSYTKQLAAYRIESDKLFETNKMLADISAGLGVDMQRLILAFGQVRSAAYLRGTELRQFTEAGIPILEQLAQYFTELEGRAVSVGDVFERVSKRMVSFADVEEIFKRMTSEGGTFYRMQEIQAETLKGMWSNLKDSVDIMVNDIGKGNESTLKSSLALVKQLVDNWRSVKAVIETAGISLMAYFGVDVLRKIGRGIKALYATISAHPLLAIVSVLGLIATAIWRVREAQNALTAAMSEVDNEILGSLEEGIGLYHKLAEAVNDATKSGEERNKALDNLKSRFQDILPDQYLELEYIKQIGDNYKDVEKAMTDYYDAKAQAQKKDRIEGLYTKELDTDTSELISATRDVVSKLGEKGIISGEMQTAMLSGISGIVNKVVEDVKAGKIDANIERIQGAIFSKLEDYAGYEGYLYSKISESPSLGLLNFGEQVSDVTDTLREYLSALEDIQGLPYETYGQKVAGEWLNKEKESLRQISEIYKKLLSLYSKYSKATDEDKVDIADDISLAMSQVPEKLNAYLPLLQESVDKMKGIAEKGAFEFTASMQTLESDFVEGLAGIAQYAEGEIGDVNGDKIAQTLSGNLQEGIKTASDKLDMTPFQNAVVGGARQIAARFGQDVNIFEKFIPNQKESLSNIRQEVKSQIESYESQILEMQTSLTQGMYVLSEEVLNNTQETIKSMTEQLPALKAFLAFLGEMEKDKGRKDNTIEERIKVVDQMNAKYKELNKTLSKTESLEGAFEAYKDAFATAYGREDVRQMSAEDFAKNVLNFPDEDAVITWLDNLAKTVKDKEDKFKVQMAKGKFEMDVQVRLKKEDDQQLLDDVQELFDQYDLSLELKKLNIPPDLAKSLFDVDYLDLEGLKKAVEDQSAKFIGTDMEDEYKKFLEKIDDMEDKAAKERMKTYVKYLMEGMSERVKLKIEEMRKLKEIEESDEFTPEQKERIKEGVSKEARAEKQKQEWKDFQGSEMYTMMFEDLEHYGTAAIEMLYTKLSELKTSLSDLPASEVKEIVGQIEKLENIQIERNPFESLKKYKEEVKNIGFSEDELQTQLLDSQRAEEEAQKYIDIYNTVMQSFMSEDEGVFEEIDAETLSQWTQMLRLAEEQGKTVEEILADRKATVKAEQDNQGKIVKNLNSYKKLDKSQEAALKKTEVWLNSVGDLFSASKGLMESLGVESDSVAMTIADTGSSMVSLILSAVQFTLQLQAMGVAANSALGIIGWIASALQAVATVLSAIFSAKDKALQKEIDGHLARAEKLHEKYEELSDAIDSAYDASVVRQFNKEIKKTIQLEIKAIEAAIAAEKSQKDSKIDWGWVDEQEKKVKELYNTLNEEHDNYIARWGGFGSDDARLDFIESMTQAWLDSFKETGDGLAGLEEKWDEYFDNLALKQMTLRVSKAAIDKYLDMWDKYVSAESAGGEDLTEAEAQDLRLKKEQLLKDLSERYTNLAESLGITPTTEGGGLSALSKSIQGITSDQAEILSAYWNSVRGYTASIDSKMDLILANMGVGAENNPMLEQLISQTSYLQYIKEQLSYVLSPSGSTALKVRILDE